MNPESIDLLFRRAVQFVTLSATCIIFGVDKTASKKFLSGFNHAREKLCRVSPTWKRAMA